MGDSIASYDYNVVNQLKSPKEVTSPSLNIIHNLQKLVTKHYLESYVAPVLLHKHYVLSNGEATVERRSTEKRWIERISTIEKFNPDEIVPIVFKLSSGKNNDTVFAPTEFAKKEKHEVRGGLPSIGNAYEVFANAKKFQKEYATFLKDNSLEDTIGIGLLRDIHVAAAEERLNIIDVEMDSSSNTGNSTVLRLFTKNDEERIRDHVTNSTANETAEETTAPTWSKTMWLQNAAGVFCIHNHKEEMLALLENSR